MYKKGDREDLTNWRPITLLNTDYKIIAKTLANRLKKVLAYCINVDQTCSVPGRSIVDNCALIRASIYYCQASNTEAAVISLDQSKAFDRVDREYLFRVLTRYGFNPSFIQWIKTLYFSIGSHVIVNNHLTLKVAMERGVRQGCPLSPLLYILTAEPLAIRIRSNPNIRGLQVPETTDCVKISSYADDNTVFIGTSEGFVALQRELSIYEEASGAVLNRKKSHGLWMGPWRNRMDSPLGIQWSSTSIKSLGITYFPSYYDTVIYNWNEAMTKLDAVLDNWRKRDLSYQGRSQVLSKFALSKVYYIAKTLTIPQNYIRQIEIKARQFIWRDCSPLVKWTVCIGPKSVGGLNAPHVLSRFESFKLLWIQYLLDPEKTARWKQFATFWYGQVGCLYQLGLRVFASRTWKPSYRSSGKLPPFYRTLIMLWRKHNGGRISEHPTHYQSACTESLWGNPLIVDSHGKTLFYPSLARAGFQTIKDIFHKPLPASRTVAATLYENLKSCIPEWWGNLPMAEYTSSFAWKEQLYLFASSNQPAHLRNLTIGQIYYRLRDEVMSEVPTCRDKWQSSLGRPINTTMWEHLWLVPHGFQLITPYFRDILWKFLHRVLPTMAQLVKCRLVDNSVCLACQSFEESIDHVYSHCNKWKQYIALASALLHRLGGPAPSASLHPLEFLLQRVQFDSQRSCEYWYVLSIVVYWQKRSKLTAKAMVLSLKFWMRETIRVAATQKTSDSMFNRYWFPFAKKTESRLELHELL